MGIPNVAGIHGALYGAQCDPPGRVQGQSLKISNYLKAFKAWK